MSTIVEIDERWTWGLSVMLICDGYGVCQVQFKNGTDWGYVCGLMVHKSKRRQGIATRLMKRVEEIVKDFGYDKIMLEVETDRLFQYEWYVRLGYERWEEDDELYYMQKRI